MDASTPSPPDQGLVLFPPGTSAARRRRRLIFVGVEFLIGAMAVWPLFSWPGVTPLVFGLPRSLAWLTSAVLLSFAMLLWLYRHDCRDESDEDGGMEGRGVEDRGVEDREEAG